MHFFIKFIPTELTPTQGHGNTGTRERGSWRRIKVAKNDFPESEGPTESRDRFFDGMLSMRNMVYLGTHTKWKSFCFSLFPGWARHMYRGTLNEGCGANRRAGKMGIRFSAEITPPTIRATTRRLPTAHNTFSLSFRFRRDLICIPRPQRDRFTRGAIPHRLTFQGRLRS